MCYDLSMTDSAWPTECREKADTLLPEQLIYLSCELGMYIDLAPIEAIDGRVQYDMELSSLFHRLGCCEILAEIAEYNTILSTINQITVTLRTLLNSINYEGAMNDLRKVHAQFIGELADLKNRNQRRRISMGNYKEK